MTIKAVLFDLGGTLIDNRLSTFETFQKILECRGIQVSTKEIEGAFTVAREELGDEYERKIGRIPASELYRMWDTHVLKALGIEDGDLAQEINEKWFSVSGAVVFPDVNPILTVLGGRGIKKGILSNAYEEEIRQICQVVGLDEALFDIIVGADTAARIKPDLETFRYALKKLGINPEEAIYVGNKIEKDYIPAEKAGMTPFLIVRSEDIDIPENIRCIRSLLSLKDYLE